jgi:hypothetical protein
VGVRGLRRAGRRDRRPSAWALSGRAPRGLRAAELAGKLEGRELEGSESAEGGLGVRSAAGAARRGKPEAVSRSGAPGLYPGRVLRTESRLNLYEPIGEAALWKENLRMGAKRCVKGP